MSAMPSILCFTEGDLLLRPSTLFVCHGASNLHERIIPRGAHAAAPRGPRFIPGVALSVSGRERVGSVGLLTTRGFAISGNQYERHLEAMKSFLTCQDACEKDVIFLPEAYPTKLLDKSPKGRAFVRPDGIVCKSLLCRLWILR